MSVWSAAEEAGAIRVILRDVRDIDSPCIVVIPTTVFSSVESIGYRRAPFWRYGTLSIVPISDVGGLLTPAAGFGARFGLPVCDGDR